MSEGPFVKSTVNSVEDERDHLEEMLDRTGCKDVHYKLSECMYEYKDWRKCQSLVSDLRQCMLDYENKKQQGIEK